MDKTAVVVGATGLVGAHLTRHLLSDDRYGLVKVFVRRPTGLDHPKLEEHVVDFDRIDSWKDSITGDELFSTMGTTLRQAGGKEAQYRVDFTYQYETARAATANGVGRYILVSSAGANPRARVFYSRMKGELEEAIKKLPFQRIVILRPSILTGERRKTRLGEQLGLVGAHILTRIVPPLRKYRPIAGETVARAMINSPGWSEAAGITVCELDEIFALAS